MLSWVRTPSYFALILYQMVFLQNEILTLEINHMWAISSWCHLSTSEPRCCNYHILLRTTKLHFFYARNFSDDIHFFVPEGRQSSLKITNTAWKLLIGLKSIQLQWLQIFWLRKGRKEFMKVESRTETKICQNKMQIPWNFTVTVWPSSLITPLFIFATLSL